MGQAGHANDPAVDASAHIPVLLGEVLELLAPVEGQTYVDLTAGLGGHAEAVARTLGPAGTVVLVDMDRSNLDVAAARARAVTHPPRVLALHANFADAPSQLRTLGVRADMVLADLGFSSAQMDDPQRGLSFRADGPLDMRLDRSHPVTAADMLATAPQATIARMLREYGEEPAAARIASAIVAARSRAPIRTTHELAEIVRSAIGPVGARSGVDPATRTFQALRIAVNDELGSLERLLTHIAASARRIAGTRAPGGSGGEWLNPGCRVAIIAFHSLEDRPVKRLVRALTDESCAEALDRHARRPDEGERLDNPRSRSARLRAIRLRGGTGPNE